MLVAMTDTNSAANNFDDDSLGGRIATAREAAGMSLTQLAKRLGIKTSTLSNWESDRSEPRSNRLIMLAGALGVSPSWLLVGFGDGPAAEVASTEIKLAMSALEQARTLHQQTGDLLEGLTSQLERLNKAQAKRELGEDLEEPAPSLGEYFEEEG